MTIRKRLRVARLIALILMAMGLAAGLCSCDFMDDDDDTLIVVKNEADAGGNVLVQPCITKISIKSSGTYVHVNSNLSIYRGGQKTFAVDPGDYSVEIEVDTKVGGTVIATKTWRTSRQKYVANGNTLTAVFDGEGLDFD